MKTFQQPLGLGLAEQILLILLFSKLTWLFRLSTKSERFLSAGLFKKTVAAGAGVAVTVTVGAGAGVAVTVTVGAGAGLAVTVTVGVGNVDGLPLLERNVIGDETMSSVPP